MNANQILKRIADYAFHNKQPVGNTKTCWVQVGMFLQNNPKVLTSQNYLLIFGVDLDIEDVSHACVYSKQGHKLVDSMGGKPIIDKNVLFYKTSTHLYPALETLDLRTFKLHYN